MKNTQNNLVSERQSVETQITEVTAQLVKEKAVHQRAKEAVANTEAELK